VADGFAVAEAWLGHHAVRSRTRAADLPAMMAQTVGAAFAVMEREASLWPEIQGSEPIPAVGEPSLPPGEPTSVDVERMLEGFRLGARDLTSIWELVLTPETLGDVLILGGLTGGAVRFPDPLWARIVYEFALGHHYGVVHRDHLLRSLVPIYLGRTAAFVQALERGPVRNPDTVLEQVGVAFERQKPYLVERWR
jgi:glucosylglycerate synthase